MVSAYAQSIGVTDSDAHTARNIHLSVGDCKHLRNMLDFLSIYGPEVSRSYGVTFSDQAVKWNEQLREYLKGAV